MFGAPILSPGVTIQAAGSTPVGKTGGNVFGNLFSGLGKAAEALLPMGQAALTAAMNKAMGGNDAEKESRHRKMTGINAAAAAAPPPAPAPTGITQDQLVKYGLIGGGVLLAVLLIRR